jgi:pyruvate formate lyase activating enzyme
MTDIGIDLKALRVSTFQEITGLVDEALARRYMETAWKAVKYLHDNHPQVFLGNRHPL